MKAKTKIAVVAGLIVLLLVLGIGLIRFAGIDFSADSNSSGVPGVQMTPDDSVTPIVLKVKAIIDGSDVLHITPAGTEWVHKAWQWPTNISMNGIRAGAKGHATLQELGLADADLSSATVMQRSGRDTVAMDKSADGVAIHFGDGLPGAGPYSITLAFAHKSAATTMPVTPATLPSSGSIVLDVKATVDGGDVLNVGPGGARWRNVTMSWPTNVAINDKPCNVRARQSLADIGLGGADLSSAEVIDQSGRDIVVMEKTTDGIAVYFCDAVGGASAYEIKIRFAPRVN